MQHFLDDHTLANGVTIPSLNTKTHSAEQDFMEEEEALVSQKINISDSPSKTEKMILEETQNLKTFQSDANHSDEPSVSENKKDLHSIQSTDVPTESNQPPLSTNPLEESIQTQINDNFPIENEEQVPFDQTSNHPETAHDEEHEKLPENDSQEKIVENQSIEIESKKNNTKNSLKKGSTEIHESPNPKKKYNRKATHSKYNELVSFIDCLSKFNWSKNYISGQKISAAKYYTPNVYWFLINAEYFPRNTFAHKNNKDSIHNRLYRLKGFTPDVPQRLTRHDLKSDVIHAKPIETSEHMQLTSFSKAIKHSTEAIRANNLAASRNINHIHRPNYTMEDDEWMIEMRRFIYENYTTLQENNESKPENFDILSKIDLQDLILLYEKDLYGIATHNEKEIDAIETNISEFIEQEEPLRKLNHDLQDSLVDFKMKFPEEEAFISYLEKKQNEAKETVKPTQPTPNESHAGKSGKKGSGSMGRKTNVKVKLEDAICQICNDADYSDDDLIVFCAKCNIGVHQQCYGIPVLPDGDWICDVCITFQEKGKYLRCPFCDKRGGAMKPTCTRVDTDLFEFANPEFDAFLKSYSQDESVKALPKIKPPNLYINKTKNKAGAAAHHDDEEEEEQDLYYDFELLDENFTEEELKDEPKPPYIWAHISCVLFIPELYFGDDIYASNILGLENINKDRFKYECSICEKRKNGAIVNCERNSCKKAFHPECARRALTFLEIRENEHNQFIYHIYCEKHTPLKLKRTIESLENKMKDEIQKFFNAIDKQYAAYLQESKPSRPELHASNATLTKEQILQEENLKRKKLLSIREEGNYFLKLIDKYIAQHKNQPLSITLQSVPSDDGVDKFEIFDINIPKAAHRTKTKLSFDDEIWRNMPYKNLTPEQKYQKYSKLHAEMKKKQKIKLLKLKSTHKATAGHKNQTQENRNQSGRRLRDREPEKPQTHVTQISQKKAKKGKVDNEEKSDIIYCVCRKTYDGKLMIDCEQCENWYHPKCVGLPKNTNWKKFKYVCKSCTEKNLAAGGLPVQSVLNKRSLDLENSNNNKKSLPSKKLKKQ